MDEKDKDKLSKDRKDLATTWIVIGLLLIVPLVLTIVISKVFIYVFPTMIFLVSDIIRLYVIVSVLMIAALMIIFTNKKKK